MFESISCAGLIKISGHVLGLHHEQKRWDRDANTQFLCDNLKEAPFTSTPVPFSSSWSPAQIRSFCCGAVAWIDFGLFQVNSPTCCGAACQYNHIAPKNSLTNQANWNAPGKFYDVNSIMHYPRAGNAKPTKLVLTTGPFANLANPSINDAARVNFLYCKK